MQDIVHDVEHSTNQHALPPPGAVELTDGDRVVGWVMENRVGFGGFATEQEAAHAAWVAYRTMARRRAWENGSRPLPIDIEPLTIHRRDGSDVIAASGRDVATLVRPDASQPDSAPSFGFEITLSHAVDELALRANAYVMYRALRRSGIRWELWRRRSAAPIARVATAEPTPATNAHAPLRVAAVIALAAVATASAVLMVAPEGSATTILLAMVLIALGVITSRIRPARWRFRPLPGLDVAEGSTAAVARS